MARRSTSGVLFAPVDGLVSRVEVEARRQARVPRTGASDDSDACRFGLVVVGSY